MGEILKWLPQLMKLSKYFKYLKYAPLLIQLVTAIREAERKFREANSGAEKRAWVAEQLAFMIGFLESSGVIGAKFATALRNGAEAIITAWVEGWKDAGGEIDPPVDPPLTGGVELEKVLNFMPSWSDIQPNWFVQTNANHEWPDGHTGPAWIVKQTNVGKREKAPWADVLRP